LRFIDASLMGAISAAQRPAALKRTGEYFQNRFADKPAAPTDSHNVGQPNHHLMAGRLSRAHAANGDEFKSARQLLDATDSPILPNGHFTVTNSFSGAEFYRLRYRGCLTLRTRRKTLPFFIFCAALAALA
jgi:hypothetical protein